MKLAGFCFIDISRHGLGTPVSSTAHPDLYIRPMVGDQPRRGEEFGSYYCDFHRERSARPQSTIAAPTAAAAPREDRKSGEKMAGISASAPKRI